MLGFNSTIGTFITCLVFAGFLTYLQNKNIFSNDTLLGILAHASLSIGIIAISLSNQYVNLDAYLFGDILTVTDQEIKFFIFAAILVFGTLFFIWEKLVLMTINENIAKADNINTKIIQSYKIQSVVLTQPIWHKKYNLGNVTFLTAGGQIRVSTYKHDLLKKIVNNVLFKAEKTNRRWM